MRDALGGVLCRCTGYTKIVEAVLRRRRGRASTPRRSPAAASRSAPRRPARRRRPRSRQRALRRRCLARRPAGVLALRVIRSPHPHAALRARRPGGVPAPLARPRRRRSPRPTCPHNAFGIFADLRDQPVLADGIVALPRRGGARARRRRRDARGSRVRRADRFAPLPAHETPAAASPPPPPARRCMPRYPDNVLCRGRVVRGDVDAALADRPARRARARASRPRFVEHAYIEPEAGWAEVIEGDDGRAAADPRLRLHPDALHGPRRDRRVLGLAPEQVHIVPVGDRRRLRRQARHLGAAVARGGRLEDRPPVRLVYERPESMLSSTKRHPAQMTRDARLRRRRPADGLRLQRRLRHRRLFVLGADGRQPRADPCHRPVPRAARARPDPRRPPTTRRRRLSRLRRAAGGARSASC